MTLRRKILLSFILLTIVNGLMTLLVLEASYLAGPTFQPGTGQSVFAPGFGLVAGSLAFGAVLVGYLLFWTIRRLILNPLDDIVHASSLLASGERVIVQGGHRGDEIGRLADSFNLMADAVVESRENLEGKIRDATERIEATQRDLAFTERLAATGRLAAGVAHEINNPLGGVMNAVARLRRDDVTPERKIKYLDICEDGLKRIQETVRRILDFSRKRRETGAVRVTEPLMQSVELVRHLLDPAGIRLAVQIEPDDGRENHLVVSADPGDLQHVYLNLLMNAVDAMANGGTLTVRAYQAVNWVIVEIEDTGIGLTIDELSASFDYFHTTKPVGKGTGLGLSIAHHIVVGYRGALTLSSEKGVGTKASVELPLIGTRPGPSGGSLSRRMTAGGGKK